MRVKRYDQFHNENDIPEGWDREDNALYRIYKFQDFDQSWGFINRVVEFAREVNHHPKITIDGNTVELWLYTHDTGSVTKKDIALAEEINKIRV